jgi:hypothetical protein
MSELIAEAAETHTLAFSDANVTVSISHDGCEASVTFTSPGGLCELSFDWTNWLSIVDFASRAVVMTEES